MLRQVVVCQKTKFQPLISRVNNYEGKLSADIFQAFCDY